MIKKALNKPDSKIVQMLVTEQQQLEAALRENRAALSEHIENARQRLQLPAGQIALERAPNDERIVVLCVTPAPEPVHGEPGADAVPLDGDR